jgi:hypothetical protein
MKYPDWLDTEAWAEYRQHRIEIKKPLTPLAESKMIKKLGQIVNEVNATQQQVIDQSIEYGWIGLFPPKELTHAHKQTTKPAFNSTAAAYRELQALGFTTGFEEEEDCQSFVRQNVVNLRDQMG